MGGKGVSWSEEENQTVRRLWDEGASLVEIHIRMPSRSVHSIASKLRVINDVVDAQSNHYYDDKFRNKLGDLRFKRAMIAAVSAGRERAPFGVVKALNIDEFRPTYFPRQPVLSLIGSSAQMCAENVGRRTILSAA